MTTDPHIIAAKITGRAFEHGAILNAVATRNRYDRETEIACRNAAQRLLKAAHDASRDMGTREKWAHVYAPSSDGDTKTTSRFVAAAIATITNERTRS